jgi:soluble lytic murein transglycosylase-like protein
MATRAQILEEAAPAAPLADRGWRTLALNGLLFLVVVNGALAVYAFREIGYLRAEVHRSLWRTEQRYQSVNAQVSFASDRRRLVLGVRDEILKTRPDLGVAGAYELASMVLDASDKFPSVDPLLLVAIGVVQGKFDTTAVSPTGARGLYQLHSTTGRLLARALGWEYSDEMLHDPAKNTEMAACYLDLLLTAYNDVELALAEYSGGPLNAGYFRARLGPLAGETRSYVLQVVEVYERLERELGSHRPTSPARSLSASEVDDLLASPDARPATAGE